MNLTCSYCQTPFTLGMAEKVAALQRMHAENLNHYDERCRRCGRANAVSRERLEMFTPGWQEAIKETAPASSSEPSMPKPPTPVLLPQPPAPASVPVTSPKAPAKPTTTRHVKPAAKKSAKPAVKKSMKKAVKAKPKKTVKKTAAKKTKRK